MDQFTVGFHIAFDDPTEITEFTIGGYVQLLRDWLRTMWFLSEMRSIRGHS